MQNEPSNQPEQPPYPYQQPEPGTPPPPPFQQQPYTQYLQLHRHSRHASLVFFKRKVGCLPMWALIIIALFLYEGVGAIASGSSGNTSSSTTTTTTTSSDNTPATQSNTQPTSAPTSIPTQTPLQHWTFTSNGMQKTAHFTTNSGAWKISWTCDPQTTTQKRPYIPHSAPYLGNADDKPMYIAEYI